MLKSRGQLKSGEDNLSDIEISWLVLIRPNEVFITENWDIIDERYSANQEKLFISKQSYQLLSPHCKQVIDAVLYKPELFHSPRRKRVYISYVFKYFRKLWGSKRVNAVFKEIKTFLNSLCEEQ